MTQLRIILSLWKATIIQAMEYRASFIFSIIANGLDFLFGFLQYLVFFTAAKSIAGWESDQMLVLYGVFMLVFALHFILFYPNLVAMGEMVNSGNLDLLLSKPVNSQLLVSFRRISLEELGSLFTAALLLGWLAWQGTIMISPLILLHFFINLACAMVIIYSGFLLLLSLAVIMERLDNMAQLLWSFFSLCRYPVDVFPAKIQRLFFTFLPVAFISTVPAASLLGRSSELVTGGGIIVATVALVSSSALWKKSINSYTSAGG
jgi:ABC-2 type transport system permease protein